MTVSGMDSSSFSRMFSGIGSGNNALYSSISDYNTIKSGSYGKLLNSYYNQTGSQSSSVGSTNVKPSVSNDHTSRGYKEKYIKEQADKSNSTSSSSSAVSSTAANNSKIASASNEMLSSLDKLSSADTYKTNSSGEYNTDDIYKTVKSYVDAYNDVIDSSKKSTVSGISSNVSSMNSVSNMYSKNLANIGITMGEDKKLSLDEKMFKSADMSKVKETFGRSNYGYSVRTNAYMTNYYAKSAQNNTSSYGANGSYSLNDIVSSFQNYV